MNTAPPQMSPGSRTLRASHDVLFVRAKCSLWSTHGRRAKSCTASRHREERRKRQQARQNRKGTQAPNLPRILQVEDFVGAVCAAMCWARSTAVTLTFPPILVNPSVVF